MLQLPAECAQNPCYNVNRTPGWEKILKFYWPKINRTILILLTLLAAVPLVVPLVPAAAADNITLSSSVQTNFPNSLTFSVTAQSSSNITQLRLHYIVVHQNFASVVSEGWAEFTPSTSVKTQWVWDMRRASIPPATDVQYWWTALDSAGNTGKTPTATVTFDDNRYQWQKLASSTIILQWYNGDSQFAANLMTAAQQGLTRIQNDTGAIPQGHVHIYIYGSQQDLLGSMLFPQQWEGGVTFGGYDTIAIAVAPTDLSFGQRVVPHELTHWIVNQLTFNNYGAGLPTWLDEGLATYGEGPNPAYQQALLYALNTNQLLSVRSLSSPFSADPTQALISYGESNSIVTYMLQRYGKSKMVQLLNVFRQGATYDDALKQVYGFDQDGLGVLWFGNLLLTASPTPGR
jgi:hypothetical protein